MPDLVECRSDSSYGERPMHFVWQEERLEVASIVHRWRTPVGKGFRVSILGGRIFDLFYDENQDEWTISEYC